MRELHGDWRDLFTVFRIALDPRKLALGFVAMALTAVTWGGIVGLFVYLDDTRGGARWETGMHPLLPSVRAWFGNPGSPEGDAAASRAIERVRSYFDATFHRPVLRGVSRRSFVAEKARAAAAVTVGAHRVRAWAEAVTPRGTQGCLLWAACLASGWFLWAMFGGAITRIAAVELAKDERIELAEAWRFVRANWRHYFWAPLIVSCGILFFALCNAVAGYWCGHHEDLAWWILGLGVVAVFAGRAIGGGSDAQGGGGKGIVLALLLVAALAAVTGGVPWAGEAALVLGFPLALLAGLLILILGIGLALGWPLMLPAVSAEGTDSFDAIARSFSYVFGRPWRYLGYHLVGAAYAVPCVTFVLGATCAFACAAMGTVGFGMDLGLSGADGEASRFAPIREYVSSDDEVENELRRMKNP